jgi:hypothetical protein
LEFGIDFVDADRVNKFVVRKEEDDCIKLLDFRKVRLDVTPNNV